MISYDSVDKAILDSPHKINNIKLELSKAIPQGRQEKSTPIATNPVSTKNTSVVRNGTNRKQAPIGILTILTCFNYIPSFILYL